MTNVRSESGPQESRPATSVNREPQRACHPIRAPCTPHAEVNPAALPPYATWGDRRDLGERFPVAEENRINLSEVHVQVTQLAKTVLAPTRSASPRDVPHVLLTDPAPPRCWRQGFGPGTALARWATPATSALPDTPIHPEPRTVSEDRRAPRDDHRLWTRCGTVCWRTRGGFPDPCQTCPFASISSVRLCRIKRGPKAQVTLPSADTEEDAPNDAPLVCVAAARHLKMGADSSRGLLHHSNSGQQNNDYQQWQSSMSSRICHPVD